MCWQAAESVLLLSNNLYYHSVLQVLYTAQCADKGQNVWKNIHLKKYVCKTRGLAVDAQVRHSIKRRRPIPLTQIII